MNTVLLIENNLYQRLLYEEELHDEGFEVVCATNAQEGLQAVQGAPIDCVVLDVRLPSADDTDIEGNLFKSRASEGVELLERLKNLCPQAPVIIYTAHGFAEGVTSQDAWEKWGASACLLKRSDVTELVSAVRWFIAHSSLSLKNRF